VVPLRRTFIWSLPLEMTPARLMAPSWAATRKMERAARLAPFHWSRLFDALVKMTEGLLLNRASTARKVGAALPFTTGVETIGPQLVTAAPSASAKESAFKCRVTFP
jgi:hypothetical protein